eukprot:8642520-Pyramimonas_sp.AAC.1
MRGGTGRAGVLHGGLAGGGPAARRIPSPLPGGGPAVPPDAGAGAGALQHGGDSQPQPADQRRRHHQRP